MHKVMIIGGGAAGMLAAATAARRGLSVTVLEHRDRTCLKLGITGKGRCNLTNNCDHDTLHAAVTGNTRFLYSAFARFSPQDVMALFESLGVPLKTERGGRVFPVSDRASDIVQALRGYARDAGVRIVTARAEQILTEAGRVAGVRANHRVHDCDAVILATGGLSYPKTGSDGGGHRMAAALGHRIVPPRASLVPLEADLTVCAPLQGLALKNVCLTMLEDGRPVFSEQGELLFTHFGLSGPLVLSASAHMTRFSDRHYRARIDLKPALDAQTLDARLLRNIADTPARHFINYLPALLPRLLVPVVAARCGTPSDRPLSALTRTDRQTLIAALKDFSFDITGPRPIDEAIVTAGGVATADINPKTMESKLVPGLFFAGELIDVDAYTGGFNLQIAWSTGYAAGTAVCP